MAQKLTEKSINRKPPAEGYTELWDSVTPGLALRINAGGRRTYFTMPRVLGKQIKFALGSTDQLTLSKARDKARDVFRDAAKGIDPRNVKEQERVEALKANANTFEAVVTDFIEKYAKPRQRTWKKTEGLLLSGCAVWKPRPFAEITKRDAYELLDGFVADEKPYKAARTLSWIRTLWRWAAKRDIVEAPIMDAVEIEIDERPRDRVYNDDELKAIWHGAESLGELLSAYVRLEMVLCVRSNELARMKWTELDDPDDPTVWTVPTERVKLSKKSKKARVYVIPLPEIAQRILKELPRTGEHVFPGRAAGKPFTTGQKFLAKVREATGIADWFPHAHRHTAATWLENNGHDEYDRALFLNHAGGGTVTSRYSHGLPLERKRAVHDVWAKHVEEVVGWSARVVKMRKPRTAAA